MILIWAVGQVDACDGVQVPDRYVALGMAWRGVARLGSARPGGARHGEARKHGAGRRERSSRSAVYALGKAWPGGARHGWAGQGKARLTQSIFNL